MKFIFLCHCDDYEFMTVHKTAKTRREWVPEKNKAWDDTVLGAGIVFLLFFNWIRSPIYLKKDKEDRTEMGERRIWRGGGIEPGKKGAGNKRQVIMEMVREVEDSDKMELWGFNSVIWEHNYPFQAGRALISSALWYLQMNDLPRDMSNWGNVFRTINPEGLGQLWWLEWLCHTVSEMLLKLMRGARVYRNFCLLSIIL